MISLKSIERVFRPLLWVFVQKQYSALFTYLSFEYCHFYCSMQNEHCTWVIDGVEKENMTKVGNHDSYKWSMLFENEKKMQRNGE